MLKKYENCILPLLVVIVNIFFMGMYFDFYYDLNDDTMMLDIMSGAYSGTPDGHNMQTLYPLGAVIALCYRACGIIPWYGLFLLLCQFGCFYLTGVRLYTLTDKTRKSDAEEKSSCFGIIKKFLLLVVLSLFVWGVCLEHFVNIQYTITAAVLSAAAVFLFLTAPDADDSRQFLVKNIPSIVMVILAYQLRSEMLLLTFPYICLAGFCRLTGEKKIFAKDNLVKYGGVLGIMLAGMLVSRGIDYAAYGSEEWKDFLQFFGARTTVYDFYPELITDDKYKEELTQLGAVAYQQALLRNYNYGLDETINTELLTRMAEYAGDTLHAAKDWKTIIREQVYRYYYRTFRGGDGPYGGLLAGMYATVLIAGLFGGASGVQKGNEEIPGTSQGEEKGARKAKGQMLRRYAVVWQLILLAAGRSAIWMFILLRGRDPERITHSLYLVEYALLLGLFIRSFSPLLNRFMQGSVLVFVLLGVVWAGESIAALKADQEWRESVNESGYAIDEYCRAHKENFYFEDVYSTVSFSRKIFGGFSDSSYANYDIMGGWMCGSPLYYEKIGQYGIVSVQKALLEQDNVYLVMSDPEAEEQGFEWIENCYEAQGISAVVRKTDTMDSGYSVYQVVYTDGR